MDCSNLELLILQLVNMYQSGQSKMSFALEDDNRWSALQELCSNIARRNAAYNEHPIDSLVTVLQNPEQVYQYEIQDVDLPRFIINSVIVSLIQIGLFIERGMPYDEAIQTCYDNGFFAWFASQGRHAASDDYDDIIDTLKRIGLWYE